jgi:hypothetical protein
MVEQKWLKRLSCRGSERDLYKDSGARKFSGIRSDDFTAITLYSFIHSFIENVAVTGLQSVGVRK